MSEQTTYFGAVAIVGRPNVGKSTLLNQLLGHKVSITSSKPNTTRHRIIGIRTDRNYQTIYVDTPGLHLEEIRGRRVNRLMNRTASSAIFDVELVVFVVEGLHWREDDQILVNKLRNISCPVVLAINKVDNVPDKKKLLPHMQCLSQKMSFHHILPICAENGMHVDMLGGIVLNTLPEGEHYFPEAYITDRSQCFMASEIIREKLMRFLGDELPYSVRVEIERFSSNNCGFYDIHGLILVARPGQKKIVIGNKGFKIKMISIAARQDMEAMFEIVVHLHLWVKVKKDGPDNESALSNLMS
ncbi:GTPase Era [secondary endosymbiont of Ctenarytaina eucalypti]|uniref:GTPase Era n=1 Tax=secondary endosymbiont of Ctenarytaina eucalypti TaxID=1199245 RepID=J3VT53_9ENTR|nr:GTPase Era [secondary endosymbiont of Ctenarytaina eucalypti]AFP85146.1 GTP-binding protein Era [secondary endosymbiont of Ctenarytaina eucalypti]